MNFIIYKNGEDFLTEVEDFIKTKEALNNLIYSIAESNLSIHSENDKPPLFFSVKDDKKVEMVAVMTPPYRLVIYAEVTNNELFKFAINNIMENRIELPGVIGPNDCAMKFSEIWKQKNAGSYKVAMKERVYMISKVKELTPAKGHIRVANVNDLPTLQRWTLDFMKEALQESDSEDAIERFVRQKIESKSIFVWEDGQLVSMTAKTRPTKKSISINLVYTPQEYRKKGYARSCVASLTERLLGEDYKYCTLFTDLMNPTSNKIYKEVGYIEVGDLLAVDFKEK